MRTIVIAEAGVNHNADINTAFKLVDVAKESGADIVKFQTAIPEEVVTKNADKADYQKNINENETQLEMTKRIHLPLDDFIKIHNYCKNKKIQFLTTTFGLRSTEFIAKLKPELFKIPSGEITNLPYLRKISSFKKKIILSTGMSNMDEIAQAIKVINSCGVKKCDLTVLHCSTEYPANIENINLRVMQKIKEKFNVDVGYSDHTVGINIPPIAVAMGAKVIEKHFTLDKNQKGPDHKASLEPFELKDMILNIRKIESALGNGIKKPTPEEMKNINVVRKSIVAAKEIQQGETLNEDNITTKRPGNGISPMLWDEIIGTKAVKNFERDELIVN